MRTDVELYKEVTHILQSDPALDTSHIHVNVKDGVVTLTGMVNFPPEIWMAKNAVQHISGIKDVAVEIKARNPEKRED